MKIILFFPLLWGASSKPRFEMTLGRWSREAYVFDQDAARGTIALKVNQKVVMEKRFPLGQHQIWLGKFKSIRQRARSGGHVLCRETVLVQEHDGKKDQTSHFCLDRQPDLSRELADLWLSLRRELK